MAWQAYGPCCEDSAKDSKAANCGQCGNALLRCHGYAVCGALLEHGGHCEHHVNPVLELDPGFSPARLGEDEHLSIDLKLTNLSPAARLTELRAHVRYGDSDDWTRKSIPARTLNPLKAHEFSLDIGRLAAGTQKAEVALDFHAEIGTCTERYAFSSTILLRVDQKDTRTIKKTINIKNSKLAAGAAGVVTTGDTIMDGSRPSMDRPANPPIVLKLLQRNATFELDQEVRGYPEGSIERDVELIFRNFVKEHHTPIPRPFLHKRKLRCGRDGVQIKKDPNDLCLRAMNSASGQWDQKASMQISRHHFDLLLQDGRLHLMDRPRSAGVWIDNERVAPLKPQVLKNGSCVSLLLRQVPHPIRFRLQFLDDRQEITHIVLRREG